MESRQRASHGGAQALTLPRQGAGDLRLALEQRLLHHWRRPQVVGESDDTGDVKLTLNRANHSNPDTSYTFVARRSESLTV
jgi:hypothetical protein